MKRGVTKRNRRAFGRFTIERPLFEYWTEIIPANGVIPEHSTTRSRLVGHERVTFELELDVAAIAHRLGHSAARARKGVANMWDGIGLARVIDRTPTPVGSNSA